MKRPALILAIAIALPCSAQDKGRDEIKKPLLLASQGSFFVPLEVAK